jgi:Leucine-rich repeat (LRR) protein
LGLELNQIEVMENLDALVNLKLMMLGGNKIQKIAGIANLQNLEVLTLCRYMLR